MVGVPRGSPCVGGGGEKYWYGGTFTTLVGFAALDVKEKVRMGGNDLNISQGEGLCVAAAKKRKEGDVEEDEVP